tara:strand:- start:386 stop:490 length:105 start_codon:yes stop_codon:yes gene_type:complete
MLSRPAHARTTLLIKLLNTDGNMLVQAKEANTVA